MGCADWEFVAVVRGGYLFMKQVNFIYYKLQFYPYLITILPILFLYLPDNSLVIIN